MLAKVLVILVTGWAAWILLNLVLLLLSAWLLKPNAPCFNGLSIVIPDWLPSRLTAAELAAVVAHEQGHRHHRHVWENFANVCLFTATTARRRAEQEIEADDYAVEAGHANALASALVKLGPKESDRLSRLFMFSAQHNSP